MAGERDALYTSAPGMAMDAPWSRRHYTGPSIDAAAASPTYVVQSRFSGGVMVAMVPRADVARMLPPDIDLAEPVASAQDTHPLVVVVGTHRDCAALVAGRAVGTAPDYRELIIAVPYVRRRGGRWLHVCVPSAHSDAAITVWNGNVHYGFAKRAARFRWQDDLLLVTSDDGALACHGAFVERPAAGGGPEPPDGFAHLRAAMTLPTLGQRAGAGPVSAYFDWRIAAGRVRPAQAYLALDQPIGTLAPCEWQAAPGGAFAVADLWWRLSWPQAPRT